MDFNIGGMNFGGAIGAAGSFVSFLYLAGLAVGLILLLFGCMYLLSFKHIVRIRQQTASGWVIVDTKAREFITKDDKVRKWRFLKWIRNSYTAPPNDYLEFSKKGRFSVECVRTTDGSIIWTKRNASVEGVDSFTSEERIITASEMRRSNEYKKVTGLDKLYQLAPAIMCIIIVVLLLAFWGKFVETTSTAADKAATAADQLRISTEQLATASDRLAMSTCLATKNCDPQIIASWQKNSSGVQVMPPIPN